MKNTLSRGICPRANDPREEGLSPSISAMMYDEDEDKEVLEDEGDEERERIGKRLPVGLIRVYVVFGLRAEASDGTGKAGHIRWMMTRKARRSTIASRSILERWI